MGERTGSRAFQWVWSYVTITGKDKKYIETVHNVAIQVHEYLGHVKLQAIIYRL
ncbi:hypothetical protein LZ32DRAFT_570038 [Colletotrichum eremochloae]|nr:hypothetical protein LZ32DRAFT_570038 [Colletotrichum eremochloae]